MALSYSEDPTLFLYTSLTAGSSHIITATSRLETILKAHKIPFKALDVATDEKARMLWGRRSKGKKLPGLVKFGSIVGDLDEIEEWNEYGELKQHIGAVSDVSGPSNASVPFKDQSPTPPVQSSQSTSRASSRGRHISISEPSDSHSRSPNPAASLEKTDTPLTMAMRQAGAEAAAKAGQQKSIKPEPISSSIAQEGNDGSEEGIARTTAPMIDPKLHKASEEPSGSPDITAGKTPAQIASEGAKRTSVDKIADSEGSPDAEAPTSEHLAPPSNEEQMLHLRRQGSMTKTPSRLSSQVEPEEVAVPQEPESDKRPMRTHRGSSISEASKEEIKEIEQRNAIPEEEEEGGSGNVVQSDDKAENVGGGQKTQDQGATAGDDAGVSVGD